MASNRTLVVESASVGWARRSRRCRQLSKDIAKKIVRQESHKACEEQQEVSEREEVIFGSHALSSVSSCNKDRKDQLHNEAHTQHRPFQEMLKASGEGGRSERSPNNQLSSRRTSTRSARRTPQRRLVSARPVLHQRAMVRAEGTAFHLGVFSLDSKISELRIFCVCHHDETTKNRSKNSLQLTERQQKRKRGKFRAKRGEKSGVSQSYKWTAAA